MLHAKNMLHFLHCNHNDDDDDEKDANRQKPVVSSIGL